jgi:2,3-bisphosphoglycerate-independent phosphoglycerate mutase
VLDGWGWRPDTKDNAIAAAAKPNFDRMLRQCPHALLATSGRAVGLPDGQMGIPKSATPISAGRLVMQDLRASTMRWSLVRLVNAPLRALIDAAKKTKGAVHLMGLLSPGGVHSHSAISRR